MSSPVVVTRIQNRRGTQAQFNALYPAGYNGIGGFGSLPGYILANYPEILLSGEIGFCTDTRRVFFGNINGEYLELGGSVGSGWTGFLTPVTIVLPPAASFTTIPALTYNISPYYRMWYSVTDNPALDWNTVGTNFSRNGQLEITAVTPFVPIPAIPPFPPVTPVNLTDTGTEVNLTANSINFIAQYNFANTQIEIQYNHNFAGPLTFNTSTIQWIPF